MDSPPPPPATVSERRDGPPTFTAEQLEWLMPRLGPSHPLAWRAPADRTPTLDPTGVLLNSGLGLGSSSLGGPSSAAPGTSLVGIDSSFAGEQ